MNNLYHKVAVASVCTALGFALGANEEAYSATFTLPPNLTFEVLGGTYYHTNYPSVQTTTNLNIGAYYEFNIGNLSLPNNTVIRHAIVETRINSVINNLPIFLNIYGYLGRMPSSLPVDSTFNGGEYLNFTKDLGSASAGDILSFDVTPFVNLLVRNNYAFAVFTINTMNYRPNRSGVILDATDNNSRLVVETADVTESVPEPTTILTAAIALGWGRWLKRKNSSQPNKTRSQG
jgi:hypothetical protein